MKTAYCSALLFLFAATLARAELKREVEYGNAAGEKLLLDVHVPDGAGPFPVALIVHGGGWTSGDKSGGEKPGGEADLRPLFDPLTKAGFTWFSINYRLAPKHKWPACFEDLQTAIRWVKAHAADYKGDARRIVLMGHGAGGQLVCLTSTRSNEDTRVQAVVALAPFTDFEANAARARALTPELQALLGVPKEVTPESLHLLRVLAPANRVKAGIPPTLIIHGDADRTAALQQSVTYHKRLRSAGVAAELITIKGGQHALSGWEKLEPGYKAAMVDWLNRTLRGSPVSSPGK